MPDYVVWYDVISSRMGSLVVEANSKEEAKLLLTKEAIVEKASTQPHHIDTINIRSVREEEKD